MSSPTLQLKASPPSGLPAPHPWKALEDIEGIPRDWPAGDAVTLVDAQGDLLGSGVLNPGDPVAAWRRFSWQGNLDFDEQYLSVALDEALGARSDEALQRLVGGDADFLPGLRVDRFGEVLHMMIDYPAMLPYKSWLVDYFKDVAAPRDIVLDAPGGRPRTASGDNLKGFWCEVDDLAFRVNLLDPELARFPLDLREQHALVGSLCADRRVLDLGAGCGGFSLQAARAGAAGVTSVEPDERSAKGIGANAAKNSIRVNVEHHDPEAFLLAAEAGSYDALIVAPEALTEMSLEAAFRGLAQGGILAAYMRDPSVPIHAFEASVAQALARTGREGRLFARVAQPFDFPVRLNFPESQALKGVILEIS